MKNELTDQHTLFGGADVAVTFEDGRAATLKVRQFKVREYRALFPLLEDEIGLCARATDQPRAAVESLAPASFEAVYATMREVNGGGFFCFARRQLERGAENLRNLPPDMVEKIMARASASSAPSPLLPPPAG